MQQKQNAKPELNPKPATLAIPEPKITTLTVPSKDEQEVRIERKTNSHLEVKSAAPKPRQRTFQGNRTTSRDTYSPRVKHGTEVKCFLKNPDLTFDPDYETFLRKFGRCGCFRHFLFPFTFLPTGSWLLMWGAVRVITALLALFWVPMIEAFPQAKKKYKYCLFGFDAIGIFDMMIRAHVAYYDSKTNELITHPFFTVKHYLATGFILDIVGSLPAYLIIDFGLDTLVESAPFLNESSLPYFLRLNRCICIYRIWSFCRQIDSLVLRKQTLWRMTKIVIVFLFHAHILACLAAVDACPSTLRQWEAMEGHCYNGTWITEGDHPEVHGAEPLTSFQLYTISFYYVSTITVGCGFTDFRPITTNEHILMTLLLFYYIFILAYVLAFMAANKSHKDYKLLRYQQQMNYLVGYMGREKLEARLSSRIIRYYDYQWLRTKGIEPQKLFSNLLPSLRKEASMFFFEDVINQIPLLQNVPTGLLRSLCVSLTPAYFLRHDVIVRRDDICDIIYFVFSGRVVVTNAENDEAHLDEGGIIGVLDVDAHHPIYQITASAISNVDMFTMHRDEFVRVLRAYPDVMVRFAERGLASGLPSTKTVSFKEDHHRVRAVDSNRPSHFSNQAINVLRTSFSEENSASLDGSGTSITSQSSDIGFKDIEGLTYDRDDSISVVSIGFQERRHTMNEIVRLVIEEVKDNEMRFDDDDLIAKSILPQSKLSQFLNIAVFLSAALSTCFVVYQWAFRNYHLAYFAVGYVCDVIYATKMIMGFRISFVDETGSLVTSRAEIGNKYYSDVLGFTLDFLSTLPLEIVAGTIAFWGDSDHANYLWVALRLNRILRLYHIWYYYMKKANAFLVKLVRLKLVRLVVYTAMYFHFCACFLHSMTAYQTYERQCNCDEESPDYNGCLPDPNMTSHPEAWFHTKKADESVHNFCSPYSMTLYYVITTFTSTTFGDVYPITPFEMYFTSFMAVSSKVWLGIALSDILSGIQNNANLSYHLAAEGVLKLYNEYGVSDAVLLKTIKYFTYTWVQNRGIIYPEFLIRAPACLRMDICATIYGEHFRKSFLFCGLSESFIRQATIRLRHEWILEQDYVVRAKETDDKLYFIHKGIIEYSKEVISPTGRSSYIRGYLTKSQYFGEAHGLLGTRSHEHSYKAETNLDVVSLSHSDIMDLFELFPQHRITILRRFYGRHSVKPLSNPSDQ